MIPDFEKINERMEQASLNDFMPGFDKEQEWQKLSRQLHPVKKQIPVWSYAAAAAMLLLLAGGGWLALSLSGTNSHEATAQITAPDTVGQKIIAPVAAPDPVSVKAAEPESQNNNTGNETTPATKKHGTNQKVYATAGNYSRKDIIRNGTPCPIEICINQTMNCPNVQPANISSCSTLEPDQSGQLTYKAHDNIGKNCSLTINEIEIRSIATGETILLTSNSSPSTAQEVFSYITGQRKGDILAGMFSSDCNHKTEKHKLRLDNSYGKLIIQ